MDILISSFSKYNEILHACLLEYDKINPELKFRVLTNARLEFTSKNLDLEVTYVDDDHGWLKSILILLEPYQEDDYVLLCMDDLMPLSFVGDEVLNAFIAFARSKNIDSLKLYEPPSQRISSSINSGFTRIERCDQDRYPISTMLSIFKVSFLRNLLKQSSDAWDFEQGAYPRIPLKSQCYTSPCNVFDFANLVIKGSVVKSRFKSHTPAGHVLRNMSYFGYVRHYLIIFVSTYKSFSFGKLFKFLVH